MCASSSRHNRKARLYAPTPAAIRRLGAVLRRGGLVAVPTETVYGLAANALDADACEGIFRAKGRPSTDPLIVHVPGLAEAEELAVFNDAARRLAAAFWPGPLTLVLPKTAVVPAIVTAGLGSVAVRAPSHPVFRRLLRAAGRPLAAPSANPFGYISPTTAGHVRDSLGERIAHILDGGACPIGVESTIVDVRDPRRVRVLRPGWIAAAALAQALGDRVTRVRRRRADRREEDGAQLAPGSLERHYSPRTPLTLVRRAGARRILASEPGTAFLLFARPAEARVRALAPRVAWLSEGGDPAEAARALFARLRELDRGGYRRIVAERAPPSPAAPALNDRLGRAAAGPVSR